MPDPVTLPWRVLAGEGRLTLSVAECETGWGDVSNRAPFEGRNFSPASPRISVMEVALGQADAQHHARRLAESHHRRQQIRIRRERALAADAQRLVDAGYEEDQLHKAASLDDVSKTVDPVVAGAIGHQELVRPGDMDKAGVAAARRGIDAAVGA